MDPKLINYKELQTQLLTWYQTDTLNDGLFHEYKLYTSKKAFYKDQSELQKILTVADWYTFQHLKEHCLVLYDTLTNTLYDLNNKKDCWTLYNLVLECQMLNQNQQNYQQDW